MDSYEDISRELIKRDPILAQVISSSDTIIKPSLEVDICKSLFHSVVSQQLSTKVADIIWGRFINLFDHAYPEPEGVLTKEISDLRSVGLSGQKSNYIKNIAEFAMNNDLSFERIAVMDDEGIIEYLTQIKGIGRWTVQMILMFPLDRQNVFPIDDLGIQTKIRKLYSVEGDKKELKTKMTAISEAWSPYKTLACKYLWQHAL